MTVHAAPETLREVPSMSQDLDRAIRAANVRMFDRLAPVYDCRCYDHLDKWHVRREFLRDVDDVLAAAGNRPGPRVLDAGCGTGVLSLLFASRGAEVVALDGSAGLLERLDAKLRDPQRRLRGSVRTVHADIDAWLDAPGGKFDVICFCSVLHHLPDYEATLRRASARLEHGGVLYILDIFRTPPSGGLRRGSRLRARFYSALARADYALDYRLKTWRFGPKIPNPDGPLAEFHDVRGSMRWEPIRSVFEESGLSWRPLPGGHLPGLRCRPIWAAARLFGLMFGPPDEGNAVIAVRPGPVSGPR